MLEGYDITLRRALRLIGLSSSMYYYKPKRDDSEALKLMSDYAEENPTHGQDMMVKVFHKSHGWNHKKTVRLCITSCAFLWSESDVFADWWSL